MALLSGTVRMPWLHSVCAVAEGAAPSAVAHPVVTAALFGRFGRVAVPGGRPGCARSLGSVFAGAIALFLGSSFRGRRTTRLGEWPYPYRDAHFVLTHDASTMVHMDHWDISLSLIDMRTNDFVHTRKDASGSFAIAPDGQFYFLHTPFTRELHALSPTLETQTSVKLAGAVSYLFAVGHTVVATDTGFCCRFTGSWTFRFPDDCCPSDRGAMCFMPACGHFARKDENKAAIDVYNGAGTGHIVRHIKLHPSLARFPLIRASAADEFLLAADGPARAELYPGPNLVLCDSDGLLRRKLSYCFFGDVCVRGTRVYAQLTDEWYSERFDILKALGFRHVFE
jgi:hypothetical protein